MLPTVYYVELPEHYYAWTQYLKIVDLDLSEITIPGSCLPGGVQARLLLRGLWPFGLLGAIVAGSVIFSYFCALRAKVNPFQKLQPQSMGPASSRLRHGLLRALPWVLFVCFCLCTSTSASIFQTFSCRDFAEDTSSNNVRRIRSYLRSDLSMQVPERRRRTLT